MNKVTRRAAAAVTATILGGAALTGCGSDKKPDQGSIDTINEFQNGNPSSPPANTVDCDKVRITIQFVVEGGNGPVKSFSTKVADAPGEGDKVLNFDFKVGSEGNNEFGYAGWFARKGDAIMGAGTEYRVDDYGQAKNARTHGAFNVKDVKLPQGCPTN